jgi:hypothetical protein
VSVEAQFGGHLPADQGGAVDRRGQGERGQDAGDGEPAARDVDVPARSVDAQAVRGHRAHDHGRIAGGRGIQVRAGADPAVQRREQVQTGGGHGDAAGLLGIDLVGTAYGRT